LRKTWHAIWHEDYFGALAREPASTCSQTQKSHYGCEDGEQDDISERHWKRFAPRTRVRTLAQRKKGGFITEVRRSGIWEMDREMRIGTVQNDLTSLGGTLALALARPLRAVRATRHTELGTGRRSCVQRWAACSLKAARSSTLTKF
jgi:hypothetical protein